MQRTEFESVIEVRGLSKAFRDRRTREVVEAVTALTFDVRAGELVAFLGPNGAGKSTTVRMLTTLVAPTAGTARIGGHDIVADAAAVRRTIGYVGQGSAAGPHHRVRDELVTQGRAQRLSAAAARRRADELLASLDLADLGHRDAVTLSGGQRRRLDVAIGLVHAPPVLFLDEPTTGLDPHSRANLWEHIYALRAAHGTTVVLTTHYLEEADAMADRVIVIDRGRLIADGSPDRLKTDLAGDRIRLVLAAPSAGPAAAELAGRLPGARALALDAATLVVTVPNGGGVVPELVRELQQRDIAIAHVSVRRPTLDDVFLALTGRSLRDAAAPEAA